MEPVTNSSSSITPLPENLPKPPEGPPRADAFANLPDDLLCCVLSSLSWSEAAGLPLTSKSLHHQFWLSQLNEEGRSLAEDPRSPPLSTIFRNSPNFRAWPSSFTDQITLMHFKNKFGLDVGPNMLKRILRQEITVKQAKQETENPLKIWGDVKARFDENPREQQFLKSSKYQLYYATLCAYFANHSENSVPEQYSEEEGPGLKQIEAASKYILDSSLSIHQYLRLARSNELFFEALTIDDIRDCLDCGIIEVSHLAASADSPRLGPNKARDWLIKSCLTSKVVVRCFVNKTITSIEQMIELAKQNKRYSYEGSSPMDEGYWFSLFDVLGNDGHNEYAPSWIKEGKVTVDELLNATDATIHGIARSWRLAQAEKIDGPDGRKILGKAVGRKKENNACVIS